LKITLSGSTSVTLPLESMEKPWGWFIQELTLTTEKAPPIPQMTIGQTGPEVRPRAQPLPAEDVDGHEDRLEEEEDPLDREEHAEDLAEAARELGPQQAELERQHRARDGPHREGHGHHLRPPPRQQERVLMVVPEAAVVGDQHQRRERHAKRGEDDVEAQRERHLAARGLELRGERQCVGSHGRRGRFQHAVRRAAITRSR
jgi:hypothetical protein